MHSPHKELVMWSCDGSVVATMNALLNKQSGCRWFKSPLCSCDVSVMCLMQSFVISYVICTSIYTHICIISREAIISCVSKHSVKDPNSSIIASTRWSNVGDVNWSCIIEAWYSQLQPAYLLHINCCLNMDVISDIMYLSRWFVALLWCGDHDNSIHTYGVILT